MSWIDQGRQEHGWFGTGRSSATLAVSPQELSELRSRVAAAVEFAADGFAGRAEAASALRGSVGSLKILLPVWAEAAGLPANDFRRAFLGAEAEPVEAWRVQQAAAACGRRTAMPA